MDDMRYVGSARIAIAGDEDSGEGSSGGSNSLEQLQAAEARQANIDDQAIDVDRVRLEHLGGREDMNVVAERPEQPRERCPNVVIVLHDPERHWITGHDGLSTGIV